MKYPKPWEAGGLGGKTYVSSSQQGPNAGLIQLGSYIYRPGTPDHTRLIRTWLNIEDAKRLRAELDHHIGLIQRREVTEVAETL